MEKISGILPASARITSVDMKNSGVARSGGPSFGRPQGLSSVVKQQNDLAKIASERHAELMEMRQPNNGPKDPQVQIVEKMAKDFFKSSASPVETVETSPVDYGPSADLDPATNSREDLDLPEVGAYLDVQA